MMKKLLIPLLMTVLLLTSCRIAVPDSSETESTVPQDPLSPESVSKGIQQLGFDDLDEEIKKLYSDFPENTRICRSDVTGDGVDDCVVIYPIEDNIAAYREEIRIYDGANGVEYTVDPRKIYEAVDAMTYIFYNKVAVYYPKYSPEIEPVVTKIRDSALESINGKSFKEKFDVGYSCSFTIENNEVHVIFPYFWGVNEKIGELDAVLEFTGGQFSMRTVYFHAADSQLLSAAEERIARPAFEEGDFTYRYYKNGLLITEYHGDGGDVVIPEEVNGLPVIAVEMRCFCLNQDVTSITANSILEVGTHAFSSMYSLTSFSAPNLVEIGYGALYSNHNLEHVEIPNAVWVGTRCCDACQKLTEIYLPKAREVGGGAFRETGLEKIDLPSAEYIGSGAFDYCNSLKEVYLPAVRELGYNFHLCKGVTIYTMEGNKAVADFYEKEKWRNFVAGVEYMDEMRECVD